MLIAAEDLLFLGPEFLIIFIYFSVPMYIAHCSLLVIILQISEMCYFVCYVCQYAIFCFQKGAAFEIFVCLDWEEKIKID